MIRGLCYVSAFGCHELVHSLVVHTYEVKDKVREIHEKLRICKNVVMYAYIFIECGEGDIFLTSSKLIRVQA